MATETTKTSAKAFAPDQYTFAPVDFVPDALIVQASNRVGVIEGDAPAIRAGYVVDDAAQFTAEGDPIPEGNPQMLDVALYTSKITQLIRLSREQYKQAGTPAQLGASVRRAITKKADQAFLTQVAPSGGAVAPMAGLFNISGVVAGGEVTGDLDVLTDLVAALESNGANPSLIVVDPLGWAELQKLKQGLESNQPILGAGADAGARTLLSLPVVVSAAAPTLSGIVIDRNEVLSAYSTIEVATSADVYFNSDSIGLRATWRIAQAVARANRLGTFTVDAA